MYAQQIAEIKADQRSVNAARGNFDLVVSLSYWSQQADTQEAAIRRVVIKQEMRARSFSYRSA